MVFRRLARFLAVLVFLAALITVLVYLWAPSNSVRFEKARAGAPPSPGEPAP